MTMDVATNLDPQIAAALAASPMGAIDFGTFTFETLPAMREAMADMPTVELPSTTTTSREVVVPGATGYDPTVRVYSPPTEAAGRPCIYWIHGGGYMFGSGLTIDARINRWVEEFDCVAVSIEYRLAPEDPYPAPLDDCYAGSALDRPARRRAGHRPGPDRRRRCQRGRRARRRSRHPGARPRRGRPGVPAPDLSDDRRPEHECVEPHRGRAGVEPGGEPPGLARLPGRAGRQGRHPGLRGAGAGGDVAGLPPAWIGVGALDVFRDEDIEYASRMLAAGIPVELHVYPGAPHGFEMIVPNSAIAQACQRDITEALRRALRPESVFVSTN